MPMLHSTLHCLPVPRYLSFRFTCRHPQSPCISPVGIRIRLTSTQCLDLDTHASRERAHSVCPLSLTLTLH